MKTGIALQRACSQGTQINIETKEVFGMEGSGKEHCMHREISQQTNNRKVAYEKQFRGSDLGTDVQSH